MARIRHGYHDDGEPHPAPDAACTGVESAGQPAGTIPQLADYLVNGYWQFNGIIAHHWGSSTITYNLGNLNATEQTIALAALNLWHEVANITFVQTSGSANINFNHDGTMQAFDSASWSGSGIMSSATIDISTDWVTTYGIGLGTYSYQTYIHEIGHALGLGHQGSYNGSATYGVDNVYANDTWQYSVMSYFNQSNYGDASYRFIMTPMLADIYAVDSIYGAGTTTRTGDTIYGFNSNAGSIYNFASYGTAPALTIYDFGGTDTLDCSGYSQNQVINLAGGSFSDVGGLVGNICIYTTSVIENVLGGSGNDTITGNAADNVLNGGAGNDTLVGGVGADVLIAGAGDDYLYIDHLDTSIDAGSGYDAIFIQDNTGTNLNVTAAHAEWVYAWIGNDTLDATGSPVGVTLVGEAGADVLRGSAHDDYLYIDNFDTLIDAGDGYDALFVYQSNGQPVIDTTINVAADHAEWVLGGAGNDIITNAGGATSVTLSGGGGNDTLTGGLANDYLYGNAGADTFKVTNNAQFDAVMDFEVHVDKVDLTGVAGIHNFADLQAAAFEAGGSTTFDLGGGNKLMLYHVTLASLSGNDFIFAP